MTERGDQPLDPEVEQALMRRAMEQSAELMETAGALFEETAQQLVDEMRYRAAEFRAGRVPKPPNQRVVVPQVPHECQPPAGKPVWTLWVCPQDGFQWRLRPAADGQGQVWGRIDD